VYDVTDSNTFNRLEVWKNHFVNKSCGEFPNRLPILVLGNKCDLEDDRQVDAEEG